MMVEVAPARALAALLLTSLVAVSCGTGDGPGGDSPGAVASSSTAPAPAPTPSAPAPTVLPAPVVAAAGDIACEPGHRATASLCRMKETADLVLAARPALVLTLGDNQYDDGDLEKFQRSYHPTWGRFKEITRPAAGNHDFADGGSGYFDYFGDAAGERGRGWYSFDVGGWHLVALNSNCSAVRGCGPDSAQHRWLVADLAAHPARCTLAYWHHARFSSGYHGDDTSTEPLWQALHTAGADLVLVGHDHHYERFAPLLPDGTGGARGIRQFVVGTGGRSLYPVLRAHAGSEVRQSFSYGILLLTLGDDGYDWRFQSTPGSDFTDAGRGTCH